MSLSQQKKELRREIKKILSALSPEYCITADKKIFEHIIATEGFQKASTVFCFVGTKAEIDTRPIIEEAWKRGKQVCVPRCISMGHMEAYAIESWDDLQEGSYGIQEPKSGCPFIEPKEIDFAIIPCLSCNHEGYRLGYGGGFYDRYLERMSCPNAVICRAKLMVEGIPVDEFDKKADIVITENELLL